ncbi:MAG TPA: zf-TFIIB domain-containing protein [Solirubrobacterales bacterium]|nr:zf-TFIIB domain-containing protein [Solirubrobacterales bacterium]
MSDQSAELTCMKCGGAVRTYQRNGITIDQCTACHGIFLDRGELERLIGAESAYLGGSGAGEHRGEDGHGGQHGKRRDRGFLGELFD